jgi:hypothetical protein
LIAAIRGAGLHHCTHYEWLKTDEWYKAEFDDAQEEVAQFLEDEAINRATRTVDPSDTMLIFVLKGARPEKYRDRHDVTSKLTGDVTIKRLIGVPEGDI